MKLKRKLTLVERTNVGLVRDHNEDYLDANVDLGIAVLADGMGGLNAGEVASAMCVNLLMEDLTSFVQGQDAAPVADEADADIDGSSTSGDSGQDEWAGSAPLNVHSLALKQSVERANSAVFHVSQTQPQCRGMGTTIVAMLFHDNQVSIAHIGDSRTYRYRNQELEQITKDHSFVQELMDKGLYTKDQARVSAQKNVVTRALGIAPVVEVEVNEHDVAVGDLYLACSDGLTDLVPDGNIETSISQFGDDLEGLADYLVDLANASGGNDNISIILVKILKPFGAGGTLFDRIVDWFE